MSNDIETGVNIGHRQIGLERTGVKAHVPNNDWSRLSYYLNCVSKGCGVDVIDDDLLDYQNAGSLAAGRKGGLLKVARDLFNPETIVGLLIFEHAGLCGDSSNTFYSLEQVDTVLAVRSSVILGGQQTRVRKIMVYKRVWLDTNYYGPMRRLISMVTAPVARAVSTSAPFEEVDCCSWPCCCTVTVVVVVVWLALGAIL